MLYNTFLKLGATGYCGYAISTTRQATATGAISIFFQPAFLLQSALPAHGQFDDSDPSLAYTGVLV